MEFGHITDIALTILVIGSGATAAMAIQGTRPLSATLSSQQADDPVVREGSINMSVAGNVTSGNTVTLTATVDGEPVPYAPVEVNGERVGTTDANGMIDVVVPDADEFEVEAEYEPTGKLKVPLAESEDDEGDEEFEEDEEQIDLVVDGTLEPGESMSITAMRDGSPVSNATVTVNGDAVGETDANGSITVQVPNADELEIEVTADEAEAEMTVAFENAEDDHEAHDEDEEEDGDES